VNRRKFVAAASTVVVGGLAGCTGGGGQIDSVTYEDEFLVVYLTDDHDVETLEALSEDESRITGERVGTETRIQMLDAIGISSREDDGLRTYTGEPITIKALNQDGDAVGETEIDYDPRIEITDQELQTESGSFGFTLQNVGSGPAEVTMDFEWLEQDELGVNELPDQELLTVMYPQSSLSPLNRFRIGDFRDDRRVTEDLVASEGSVRISTEDEFDPIPQRIDTSTNLTDAVVDEVTPSTDELNGLLQIELLSLPEEATTTYEWGMQFTDITADVEQQEGFVILTTEITYHIGTGEETSFERVE